MKYQNRPQQLKEYIGRRPGRIRSFGRLHLTQNELATIEWLSSNLGGPITILPPSNIPGEHTPDIRLGSHLLEIKHCRGTSATLDKALHRAIKQSHGELVLLDVTGSAQTDKHILHLICHRMERNGGEGTIIIRDGRLIGFITKKDGLGQPQ